MTKSIANQIIETCLDISKDNYSNNATTYFDYYNLEDFNDKFKNELMNYIKEDERVVDYEIFSFNDNDITIIFKDEYLEKGE